MSHVLVAVWYVKLSLIIYAGCTCLIFIQEAAAPHCEVIVSTTIYYVGKLKRFDFGDWWFLSMKPQSMFRNLKDPFCWEKERGRQKEGQGFKLSPENNLSWPRNWICVSSGCATCLMLHLRLKLCLKEHFIVTENLIVSSTLCGDFFLLIIHIWHAVPS